MSHLALMTAYDIAADIFDEVDLSYHPNIGNRAVITTKRDEVTCENTQTTETIDLRDVYLKFDFDVYITDGEAVINKLEHVYGARGSMTILQMLGGFSHPHFEYKYGWSPICMGATTLKEKYQAMRHGEQLDEDNLYYLMAMLDELLHTESMEGGPFRYMGDLRDNNEHILEDLKSLGDSIPEDGEPIAIPENVGRIFANNNQKKDLRQHNRLAISDSQYKEFFDSVPLEDFKQWFKQAHDAGLIYRRSGEYIRVSPYEKTTVEMINDNLSTILEIRNQLVDYGRSQGWWGSQRFREVTFRVYKFDYDTSAANWLFSSSDEEIAIGIPQIEIQQFQDQIIYFRNEVIEKVIEGYEDLGLANNNFKYEEITYHEQTFQIIDQIRFYANRKEGEIDTEAIHGYARSFVAAARS